MGKNRGKIKNKIKKLLVFSVITGVLTLGATFNAHASTRYNGQAVTAYVCELGSLTASEKIPIEHYVAVHPKNYNTNDWNDPIFNFGSAIYTDALLYVPNFAEYSNYFVVQDTGELNNQSNLSREWFDIWCGTYPKGSDKTQAQSWKNAKQYGIATASYVVYN